MNFGKLFFYLLLYIHLLACVLWMAIESGQGKRYYRVWEKDRYENYLGEVLIDENNQTVRIDQMVYLKFGEIPTFASDNWNRPTSDDMIGADHYVKRWDSKYRVWYMPLDFFDYTAQ